jgi:hypothetical protein
MGLQEGKVLKPERYSDVKEVNKVGMMAGWRVAIWILAAVVFFGGISVAVWYFGVAASDEKGKGEQTKIVNDGQNRVNAQEWFEGQYGKILETDRQIVEAAAQLKASPADEIYKENLIGLKNSCIRMTEAYDAEANKVSRGQWKREDLPLQIDDTNTKTDCKETTK